MIKSPCIRVCRLDNDVCIGCKRTLLEIKEWSKMTNQDREAIIQEIKERNIKFNKENGL